MTVITLGDCPICHSRDLAVIPTPRHWVGETLFCRHADLLGLTRCIVCDFVFVNPRPDESSLDEFYSSHDFANDAVMAHEPASRRAALQLAGVERFMRPRGGARLLDYGCGEGLLLREALAAGWNAIGYDIGVSAIAACRQRGLPVVDALDDIADERFDVIVLSHVFEHLANPSTALESLKVKLVLDGLIFFEVPNAKSLRAKLSPQMATAWLGFDERYRAFPIHLSYFSARAMLRLLRRHGMAAAWMTTTGLGLDRLIAHRNEHEVAGPSLRIHRAPSVRGGLRRFARDAFKQAFFGLGMGENLLVIARMRAHGGEGGRK